MHSHVKYRKISRGSRKTTDGKASRKAGKESWSGSLKTGVKVLVLMLTSCVNIDRLFPLFLLFP